MSGFNLSALAVRERSVTLFAILLISLAGVFAFFKLGRAEDPAFTVKAMTVVTAWPGATAQEMRNPSATDVLPAETRTRYARRGRRRWARNRASYRSSGDGGSARRAKR
jgi:hypothetical protein